MKNLLVKRKTQEMTASDVFFLLLYILSYVSSKCHKNHDLEMAIRISTRKNCYIFFLIHNRNCPSAWTKFWTFASLCNWVWLPLLNLLISRWCVSKNFVPRVSLTSVQWFMWLFCQQYKHRQNCLVLVPLWGFCIDFHSFL